MTFAERHPSTIRWPEWGFLERWLTLAIGLLQGFVPMSTGQWRNPLGQAICTPNRSGVPLGAARPPGLRARWSVNVSVHQLPTSPAIQIDPVYATHAGLRTNRKLCPNPNSVLVVWHHPLN